MDTHLIQPLTDRAVARVEIGTHPDFDRVSAGLVVSHEIQVRAVSQSEAEARAEAIRLCHAALVREVYGGVHEMGYALLDALRRRDSGGGIEELRTLGLRLANYGKSFPKLKVRTVEPQTKGRGA